MLYYYYTNKMSTLLGTFPAKGFVDKFLYGKSVFIPSTGSYARGCLIYDRCLTIAECYHCQLKLGTGVHSIQF